MRPLTIPVEHPMAKVPSRSHGVATRAGLLRGWVTSDEIRRRVRRGALVRVHPGVYRVGHRAPSVEATNLVAVRARGEAERLAAAHLLGPVRGPAPQPEVTAPTVHRVAGVRTRRS